MIRSELIAEISRLNPDIPKEEIEKIVLLFFEEISASLQQRGRVDIRGFGNFSCKKHGHRVGRNPKTGELLNIPEKYVPYFKAGKRLRNAVDDSS